MPGPRFGDSSRRGDALDYRRKDVPLMLVEPLDKRGLYAWILERMEHAVSL